MKYFLLFILISLASCREDTGVFKKVTLTVKEDKPQVGYIETITIDSCQYILYGGYGKGGIVHKENCNNKIHNLKPNNND